MKPTILFYVPSDDLAPIADLCAYYGGAIEFTTPNDTAGAMTLLTENIGNCVTVEFETTSDALDDPLEAITAISKLLDARNGRYLLFCDSFIEPSRGLTIHGRVISNLGAGPQSIETTSADLDSENISKIVAKWLDQTKES